MARRVFTVADPRCGRSAALSQASTPGRICGFARTHQASREGLALAERPGQGLLVDDRATRGIDQHGRGFHQGQAPDVDQLTGLRGEAYMQRDGVGLAKQILQVPVIRAEIQLHLGGPPVYVEVHDAHGEPAGTADQACPIRPKPTMSAVLRRQWEREPTKASCLTRRPGWRGSQRYI